MLKRLLSLVLAALIAVPAPVLPAQAAPPSIERPVAHAAGDAAPALPRLAQRLGDTIPPLYMLGGDDKIAPVALWNAATDAFPSTVLTHSRTSLATMFDSTGKLTYAPNNLVLNSATLSTQTVAVQAGVNYVLSIKGTGSVTNSGANASTLNGTGASNRVNLAFTASTASLTLTVTGSVTAARLSAVTYETTLRSQDDVDTTAAAYYGPRFDYSYNGAAWVPAGLLVEGAATNLIVRSGDQSNASWSVLGGTVTPLAGAAPDGVSSAYTLALSGASLSGVRQLLSWTAGNTGTFTFYVRSSSSGGAANVRLTTNNSVAWSTGITTKLALTSQWQRITLSGALTSSGTQIFTIVGNANADGTVDATCAGNVDVAFAKLEAGAMATSYIPTGASAVTRASDALTAASLTTNPAIIQYRSISTGTRARKVINPWSGISSETDMWIERIWIYPVGTPGSWLNARLVVDGPFTANDNVNPFAPQFAANDNLPVHWRIAL